MKVGDLKKMLENIPDDVPVVVEGSDHTFYAGRAFDTRGLQQGVHDTEFTEWFDPKDPDEEMQAIYGKPVRVLLVSGR